MGQMNEKHFKTLVLVAIVGLVAGTWGLVNLLLFGKTTVAYGSYITWGLEVSFYLFFLGLTAGAFLITILTYVFRIKLFTGIGPLSAFTVLVALACEVIIIGLDLGHPFRVYRILLSPNFSSMMGWMIIFTVAMLVIYVLECFFLLRENLITWAQAEGRPGQAIYRTLALGKTTYDQADRQRDQKRVYILSIISLPVGMLFYGINGAIFGVLLNRPLWNTMAPLLFVMTALLSGGALIAFLAYVFQPDDEMIHTLGHTIGIILGLFLLLEFLQILVGYKSGVLPTVTSLNLILFGPYWWAFWIVHLVIGSFIPLYLLVTRPHDSRAVAWACFLILLTFIAVRLNFLIPDQAVYKLEGLQNAFFDKRLRVDYVPNLNEWLVCIWVTSLGLLAFLLGTRWLPVISAGKGEEKNV
jgi:Ni/Fe-hydrogenase subunit HybB-like protein